MMSTACCLSRSVRSVEQRTFYAHCYHPQNTQNTQSKQNTQNTQNLPTSLPRQHCASQWQPQLILTDTAHASCRLSTMWKLCSCAARYQIAILKVLKYGEDSVTMPTVDFDCIRTKVRAFRHTVSHECLALQQTATHGNALQHTATHCNIMQHTATH